MSGIKRPFLDSSASSASSSQPVHPFLRGPSGIGSPPPAIAATDPLNCHGLMGMQQQAFQAHPLFSNPFMHFPPFSHAPANPFPPGSHPLSSPPPLEAAPPKPSEQSVIDSNVSMWECPVCYEEYNDADPGSHRPILLVRCGHATCVSCADDMCDKETRLVKCPICTTQSARDNCPLNRTMLDCVRERNVPKKESVPPPAPSVKEKCRECAIVELESPAHSGCTQCCMWLCKSHSEIHINKQHWHVLDREDVLADVRMLNIIENGSTRIKSCPDHLTGFNSCSLYCITCEQSVCMQCLNGKHADHAVGNERVKTQGELTRSLKLQQQHAERIDLLQASFEQSVNQFEQSIKELKTAKQLLSDSVTQAMQPLDATVELMIGRLQADIQQQQNVCASQCKLLRNDQSRTALLSTQPNQVNTVALKNALDDAEKNLMLNPPQPSLVNSVLLPTNQVNNKPIDKLVGSVRTSLQNNLQIFVDAIKKLDIMHRVRLLLNSPVVPAGTRVQSKQNMKDVLFSLATDLESFTINGQRLISILNEQERSDLAKFLETYMFDCEERTYSLFVKCFLNLQCWCGLTFTDGPQCLVKALSHHSAALLGSSANQLVWALPGNRSSIDSATLESISLEQLPIISIAFSNRNMLDVSELTVNLPIFEQLRCLDLSANRGIDWNILGSCCRPLQMLFAISVSHCGITESNCELAFSCLQHITSLVRLDLSGNTLGTNGFLILKAHLEHFTALRWLDLSCFCVDGDNARIIVEAAVAHPTLTHLRFKDWPLITSSVRQRIEAQAAQKPSLHIEF